MMKKSILLVGLPVLLGVAACGGGSSGPAGSCGEPGAGDVASFACGPDQVCVCAIGECAVEWPACATGYRLNEGTGPCLTEAQLRTAVASTPDDHPACPSGSDAGDDTADGDDGTGEEDAGETDGTDDAQAEDSAADDGADLDSETEDGDEDASDGSQAIELAVFNQEEMHAEAPERREVTQSVSFPIVESYSQVLLDYRLRTGCPSLCETTSRVSTVTLEVAPGTEVELLRIMTPYGAHRNFLQDVTDLAPLFTGIKNVRLFIDTVEGAWEADLRFFFTPGTPPRDVMQAVPVALEPQLASGDGPHGGSVTVGVDAVSATLLLRATGHDPDGGACDETCQRHAIVAIDGTDRFDVVPWRTDCGDFVSANPGASSDVVSRDRSGWCPADLVGGQELDATSWLAPGGHTVTVRVDGIEAGAYWNVGLVLLTYQ